MSRAEDIIELTAAEPSPASISHAPGGPIKRQFCTRRNCGKPPEDGHDFCAPCLAWLRGDSDDDPTALPDKSAPNLEPDDEIAWFIEQYGGGFG